jgi:hypothetical protein
MGELNLVLTIPQGIVVATSLGLDQYAKHRSPGSSKFFRGKTVMIDLALKGDRPAFSFREEGGWRDAYGDTAAALAAVRSGKRTKTALSNDGFNVISPNAYRQIFLVKTGGFLLPMAASQPLLEFVNHACHEELTPDQIAHIIGRTEILNRVPRLLMVLMPVQLLVMTNLLPEEYAWYSTHRPGKIFRQVLFTELSADQPDIAAASRYADARDELAVRSTKKTKVIAMGECFNDVPFHNWVGYGGEKPGGLYSSDRNGVSVWPFPAAIPRSWDQHND